MGTALIEKAPVNTARNFRFIRQYWNPGIQPDLPPKIKRFLPSTAVFSVEFEPAQYRTGSHFALAALASTASQIASSLCPSWNVLKSISLLKPAAYEYTRSKKFFNPSGYASGWPPG